MMATLFQKALSELRMSVRPDGDLVIKRENLRSFLNEVEEIVDNITAERDAHKETARQHTKLAAEGIYYTTDELRLHDIEIRAEAGRAGWMACIDWLIENSSAELFADGEAEVARDIGKQYAEQIRKAGA